MSRKKDFGQEMNIGGISVKIATFSPKGRGRKEWHIGFEADRVCDGSDFPKLLAQIEGNFDFVTKAFLPESATLVFSRVYLSDISNQWTAIKNSSLKVMSAVGQPPLSGAKIALLCVFQENVSVEDNGRYRKVSHGDYTDLWYDSVPAVSNSYDGTMEALETFRGIISESGGSMLGNAVRTWFYVHDIDTNYSGVVDARNKEFQTEGLLPSTRYIASTGIGGDSISRTAPDSTRRIPSPLTFTGYAVSPLSEGQMSHLKAADRMSPTHLYGVAFERASTVDYGDRRHIFISGTASIDTEGKVMYAGDIKRQTERMLGNVEALLREGEASWQDVMHAVVYLRDSADYRVVKREIEVLLPEVPVVIVQGPVCRPEWLVEMECLAIAGRPSDYPDF